jgi:hypothetical protein
MSHFGLPETLSETLSGEGGWKNNEEVRGKN